MTMTVDQIHRELRKGLRLTRGELLYVKRRRAGMTQAEMAKKLGVTLDAFRVWERGLGDEAECPSVTPIPVAEMTLLELFTIRRRRLGVTIAYLADVMDRSVGWVHRAQTGKDAASAERLANLVMKMTERGLGV